MNFTGFFDGIADEDVRLQNLRAQKAKQWQEFRDHNPYATLDDMAKMSESLSDGSNYIMGGLPSGTMMEAIAKENAGNLQQHQQQQELANYQADAARHQAFTQLTQDDMLGDKDDTQSLQDALAKLPESLRPWVQDKIAPNYSAIRAKTRNDAMFDIIGKARNYAPDATDMSVFEPIFSGIPGTVKNVATPGLQAMINKNKQDRADKEAALAAQQASHSDALEFRKQQAQLAATQHGISLISDMVSKGMITPDNIQEMSKSVAGMSSGMYGAPADPGVIQKFGAFAHQAAVTNNNRAQLDAERADLTKTHRDYEKPDSLTNKAVGNLALQIDKDYQIPAGFVASAFKDKIQTVDNAETVFQAIFDAAKTNRGNPAGFTQAVDANLAAATTTNPNLLYENRLKAVETNAIPLDSTPLLLKTHASFNTILDDATRTAQAAIAAVKPGMNSTLYQQATKEVVEKLDKAQHDLVAHANTLERIQNAHRRYQTNADPVAIATAKDAAQRAYNQILTLRSQMPQFQNNPHGSPPNYPPMAPLPGAILVDPFSVGN